MQVTQTLGYGRNAANKVTRTRCIKHVYQRCCTHCAQQLTLIHNHLCFSVNYYVYCREAYKVLDSADACIKRGQTKH